MLMHAQVGPRERIENTGIVSNDISMVLVEDILCTTSLNFRETLQKIRKNSDKIFV